MEEIHAKICRYMRMVYHYLNPIRRLGNKNYSYLFPTLLTFFSAVALEVYANVIVKDPEIVGLFAIFIFIALIIYFAFRDGILGGFIASSITISYYFYIIYSRSYEGNQLVTSIETTIILGLLYFFLAGTIGWLKQTIDSLIQRETDEKRRLQAIIEQLPVGVIITDNHGTIMNANEKVGHIMGMQIPIGYTFGKKTLLESLHKGKPANPSQTPIMKTLQSGIPVVGQEFTVIRKDKSQAHVQVSASAIHNKQGSVIAAASIISDITEQKEMEKRKDDFVNIASHELKTPITSMKLYIDVLSKRIQKYDDIKIHRIIDNIKNQTERLQKLVNDLLDVSRLQTGKLTFTSEKFIINPLISEIVEVLQASTIKTIQYENSELLTVVADKFRIYQVLTNVITNAIKYSGEGTEIKISLSKKNNKAIISVQDYGIGIPKDKQDKIFERLYQVTEDTEKTFPGFGMGLYISKEIIKHHKGEIWVKSKKGQGSTFYFTLPLSK